MLSVVNFALLRQLLEMFHHNLAFRESKITSNKPHPVHRCAKNFTFRHFESKDSEVVDIFISCPA